MVHLLINTLMESMLPLMRLHQYVYVVPTSYLSSTEILHSSIETRTITKFTCTDNFISSNPVAYNEVKAVIEAVDKKPLRMNTIS